MGVSDLWNLLRSEGMVREYNIETDGQMAQRVVAQKLEGKIVAVDVSLWTCQALTQGALADVFPTEESRVLKVAFDRVNNYLRFGCTPVAVLDGEAPEEKLQTLQARFFSRFNREGGGGGNAHFEHLCSLTAQLFRAMGLWVVQAPGEAEAVCAALDRAGHVDACVTRDSDALLFGAQTLFQTIKPVTSTPNECRLVCVGMGNVRANLLGIEEGGELALTALALLTGGDYHIGGAENVGQKQALAVVKHLLRGRKTDADVLEDLADLLAQSPEEHAEVLSHDKCTGCKRCGHEGGRKSAIKNHSSRNPCDCCPPAPDGTCRERPTRICHCAFHLLESERVVYKAMQKARESPGFAAKAAAAQDAYREQMEAAAEAVEELVKQHGLEPGQRLTWQERPDVGQVARLVERWGLPWDEQRTRGKMMALLMEWDASNPSTQAEFVPTELLKLHGSQEDKSWRYLMAWKRTSAGNLEDVELDKERLQETGKSVEYRCLRFATVRDHWPELLRGYKQKKADAADKAAKKAARKAAKEGRAAPQQTAAQSRELARMQATMQAFIQRPKKQQAGAKPGFGAAPTKSGSDADRGLGNLRPSASARGRDATDRGARDDGATAEAAEQPGASGQGGEESDAALARRLGVHSSSSGESLRGDGVVSEGQAWGDVLADDGASTPRGTAGGSEAAGAAPAGLQSPGKRGRAPTAAADSSSEDMPADRGTARANASQDAAVILLASPEKRRRTPNTAEAALAEPPSPGRAAGQAGPVPGGQPSAAAQFSIRQRPASLALAGQGRGRRSAAAAAGIAHIGRYLQKLPGSCAGRASEGGTSAAQQAAGIASSGRQQSAGEGSSPRGSGTDGHGSQDSPIDLTQSSPPQRGAHEQTTAAVQCSGSRSAVATVLRSPDDRCSVEREIEELLQSRGMLPRPGSAEQTPLENRGRGRTLSFMTPSTDGDIVLDLVTPPSSQPAGE